MLKLLLITTITLLPLLSIAQDTLTNKDSNRIVKTGDTTTLTASFYHPKYNGRRTSNGEIYSDSKPSAASNDYPLGTKLLIINKSTGQTVTVVVNDRMADWIVQRIDLSRFAFKKIGKIAQGLQKVSVVQIL